MPDVNWLLVAIGGAAGALARYGAGLALHPDRVPQAIPYATLLVNVLGSLLLGWLFWKAFGGNAQNSQQLWLLAGVGFCGGFTTMSTLSVETIMLVQRQQASAALANWTLQSVLCLGAAWLGLWLGKQGS